MTQKSVKTVCPYCGVGCGMVLQVEDGQVVKISGDKEHPANFGRLCTKGTSAHVALRKSGRLESAFQRDERGSDPIPLLSELLAEFPSTNFNIDLKDEASVTALPPLLAAGSPGYKLQAVSDSHAPSGSREVKAVPPTAVR